MNPARQVAWLEAEIEDLKKAAESNAREANRCRDKYMELKQENERLRAELEKGKRAPAFLDQALNEGDGVYRP